MSIIKFNFEDQSIPSREFEFTGTDISVLELTEQFDIHLNHNCGGVCACSTCHVYLLRGENAIEEISEKEEDFIDRAINPRLESRLACQCIILKENVNIEVEIPDQRRIIGHEH
ncbi:MAG: 2Fe-2S iron-sulfur cluster binding domain-containing protein [Saprospiraceae bacterium]|nr:2Fe-2S iron-sulfur cluster binding domain-containing protein [Saprospiraceae bacterium]HMW39001.1 2Fe-2S iron-sulfur cluster-binding protein [Saprospiraceae bacterium]HMX87026.1 2Fe-2S iron-sulfur cluster-binding protein [Saprospiraceae bacterium]HMZ39795.1 2Fe-2S iron-sulfur cluster-binding protein [Saprospiraceae bacterium]HNA63527.1 2Fe-2S iron-sulfur cluster-binding protein [Saprospiraceae bacterium]